MKRYSAEEVKDAVLLLQDRCRLMEARIKALCRKVASNEGCIEEIIGEPLLKSPCCEHIAGEHPNARNYCQSEAERDGPTCQLGWPLVGAR